MCSLLTKYALPRLLYPLFAKGDTLNVFYNLKLQLDPDILTESENRSLNQQISISLKIVPFSILFSFLFLRSTCQQKAPEEFE